MSAPAPKRPRRIRTVASYLPTAAAPPPAPRDLGPRLGDPAEVWRAAAEFHDARQEVFLCFDLNVRNRVIQRRIVSVGTLTGVEVHPRDVFRGAIEANAAALILVHNHPSGDPSPSRQDIELTGRLKEGAAILGIAIHDHVIVTAHGYVSLVERGMLI